MSDERNLSPKEVDLMNDDTTRPQPLWIKIDNISYNVDVAYKMEATYKDRPPTEEPDFRLYFITGDDVEITKERNPDAHDVLRVYFDYRERPFIEEPNDSANLSQSDGGRIPGPGHNEPDRASDAPT
jgi:hypothetical protein